MLLSPHPGLSDDQKEKDRIEIIQVKKKDDDDEWTEQDLGKIWKQRSKWVHDGRKKFTCENV